MAILEPAGRAPDPGRAGGGQGGQGLCAAELRAPSTAGSGRQGALWREPRRARGALWRLEADRLLPPLPARLLRAGGGRGMDRNPSPPPPRRDEDADEDVAGGDCIGSTVYSRHWLFGVLSGLIQIVSPENTKSSSDDEEQQMELDEEMENEICRVWDMSMDEDVALFLQEFNAPDIFMGVLAKSKCPRLREICVGILGNMACFQEICVSISNDNNLGQVLLHCLYDSDPPTLLETSRLLLTCLSQTEVASVWVERIREYPAIYDSICFIMSSSTNVDLLVKVGEVVDKLFDLDEKLMLEWIRNGAVQPQDPPQEDSEEQPVFRIVPCVLEAAKQVRSENPEGLDVYMHILQLLTTVDDGIQAIVQCPDTGKDTWNLLFDLVCHEFCQSDDPPIILQEQKTVLASVYSVLSSIYASQAEQEYLKIEEDLPLIDSLIRVLQNMEHCQKKPENSADSNTEETKKSDLTQDDFHLKILKDISCEFLSNIFQVLTKETVARGLKEGQLSKQKCSCAFQNLLPFYSPVIEDFLKILHEVDKTLADDLEESFPNLKVQT
uniref:Protein SAAL1 n=2 Tax=Canis lupus familiaris TaxID=9615 RepID=A0A8P0NRT3_CANLF